MSRTGSLTEQRRRVREKRIKAEVERLEQLKRIDEDQVTVLHGLAQLEAVNAWLKERRAHDEEAAQRRRGPARQAIAKALARLGGQGVPLSEVAAVAEVDVAKLRGLLKASERNGQAPPQEEACVSGEEVTAPEAAQEPPAVVRDVESGCPPPWE